MSISFWTYSESVKLLYGKTESYLAVVKSPITKEVKSYDINEIQFKEIEKVLNTKVNLPSNKETLLNKDQYERIMEIINVTKRIHGIV